MSIKTGNYEGVNFGNIFINNENLFKELFAQYYDKNFTTIKQSVLNLHSVLSQMGSSVTEASSLEFNSAWAAFKSNVLMITNPLQLLVIYRGAKGTVDQVSSLVNQDDVTGSGKKTMTNSEIAYGIRSGDLYKTDLQIAKKSSQIEEFLQKHIEDFIEQLNSPISSDESKALRTKRHRQHMMPYYQKSGVHLSGRLWRHPFYGTNSASFYGGRGLGQVYDAFMNHLANFQPQIYKDLSQGTVTHINTNNLHVKETVFEEEGGVSKQGNFPKLLHESKNTTAWYSGGDIIIVNPEDMSIAYNIQLKSTGKNIQSVFGIRVTQLRNFINELYTYVDDSSRMAEILFKNLKTSASNKRDFDKLPQEEIEKMIKENLKF